MKTVLNPISSTRIRLRTYARSGQIDLLDRDAPLIEPAIRNALVLYREVTLDFRDLEMVEAAACRFLGNLIHENGQEILRRLRFSGCTERTRSALFLAMTLANGKPMESTKRMAVQ